jgi:hypothetical protein
MPAEKSLRAWLSCDAIIAICKTLDQFFAFCKETVHFEGGKDDSFT